MKQPRFLWIDGIGGYAFCVGTHISIGLATPSTTVDLPVRGQLSKMAGEVSRSADLDWIEQRLSREDGIAELLRRSLAATDRFLLGDVGFTYERPTPLSKTACLKIVGPASWSYPIDGALLVGRSCIIGNSPLAHVCSTENEGVVVIYQDVGEWWVRFSESLGPTAQKRAPSRLILGRRIQCEEYSICLE